MFASAWIKSVRRVIFGQGGYERWQKHENKLKECSQKGHNYGAWSKKIIDNQEIWDRTCQTCGYHEYTNIKPVKKIKRIFKRKKP